MVQPALSLSSTATLCHIRCTFMTCCLAVHCIFCLLSHQWCCMVFGALPVFWMCLSQNTGGRLTSVMRTTLRRLRRVRHSGRLKNACSARGTRSTLTRLHGVTGQCRCSLTPQRQHGFDSQPWQRLRQCRFMTLPISQAQRFALDCGLTQITPQPPTCKLSNSAGLLQFVAMADQIISVRPQRGYFLAVCRSGKRAQHEDQGHQHHSRLRKQQRLHPRRQQQQQHPLPLHLPNKPIIPPSKHRRQPLRLSAAPAPRIGSAFGPLLCLTVFACLRIALLMLPCRVLP